MSSTSTIPEARREGGKTRARRIYPAYASSGSGSFPLLGPDLGEEVGPTNRYGKRQPEPREAEGDAPRDRGREGLRTRSVPAAWCPEAKESAFARTPHGLTGDQLAVLLVWTVAGFAFALLDCRWEPRHEHLLKLPTFRARRRPLAPLHDEQRVTEPNSESPG